jgi:radical SAM protein with 4Fe4S-binding SPASM domain
MDKRMPEIIRTFRASCPEAFITLASNGDLLTPEILQNLLQAGLDSLGLSIDDDQSFQKLKHYWKNPRVRLLDEREEIRENRGGQIKRGKFVPQIDQACRRPFHMAVIKPNGDMVLCCADMYGDVVMENIRESRLEEIWNSEKFRKYRRQLATNTREGLPLCSSCSYEGGGNPLDFPLHVPCRRPLHMSLIHMYKRMNSFFPGNPLDRFLRRVLTSLRKSTHQE